MLFDLDSDPKQEHPLNDPHAETRMINLLHAALRSSDAPVEQYQRLGLDG